MFKVKENKGSNVETNIKPTTKAPATPTKPIKEMSQDELLAAIKSGSITAPGKWEK